MQNVQPAEVLRRREAGDLRREAIPVSRLESRLARRLGGIYPFYQERSTKDVSESPRNSSKLSLSLTLSQDGLSNSARKFSEGASAGSRLEERDSALLTCSTEWWSCSEYIVAVHHLSQVGTNHPARQRQRTILLSRLRDPILLPLRNLGLNQPAPCWHARVHCGYFIVSVR